MKKRIMTMVMAITSLMSVPATAQEAPGMTAEKEQTGIQSDKNGMERVTFPNRSITLVGNLYYLDNFDKEKKYPAVICVHPAGGVKEQTAGLYAKELSKNGFVALAFDASYNGESGGEPRLLEDPFVRCEDIRCAVDYLVTLPFINEDCIGALGVCIGGGYVMGVTPTERRIKAAASVSATDAGAVNREGWMRGNSVETQIKNLEAVSAQRTKEARGVEPLLVPTVPEEFNDNAPAAFKEGYEYYRTPRGQHPRSIGYSRFISTDKKMAFSAIAQANLFTQPALLIIGSKAESAWSSRMIYDAIASERKELFVIDGASHVDLYDKPEYVPTAVKKLYEFYHEHLQ